MAAYHVAARRFGGRNLVWVVDGSGFRQNFDLYHMLPDPRSKFAEDIVWVKAKRPLKGAAGGLFFSVSESRQYCPDATKTNMRGGIYRSLSDIKMRVEKEYRGHHQYDWVRPRRTWLDATCPVYLDFGEVWLVRLETYDETGLQCARLVSKRKFVHDVMVETTAANIASRFYPIA